MSTEMRNKSIFECKNLLKTMQANVGLRENETIIDHLRSKWDAGT